MTNASSVSGGMVAFAFAAMGSVVCASACTERVPGGNTDSHEAPTEIEERLGFKADMRTWWRDASEADRRAWSSSLETRSPGFRFERLIDAGPSDRESVALFRHLATSAEFVLVPRGSYQIGPIEGDPRADATLERARSVRFSTSFLIGRTEWTNALWEAAGGVESVPRVGDRLPVHGVDRRAALAHLSAVGLTLPTEAQWEAAAFGSHREEAWQWLGSEGDLTDHAVWVGPSGTAADIAPVGSRAPNGIGLYDVLGNVSEWCLDSWLYPVTNAFDEELTDPIGPPPDERGAHRKGGSVSDPEALLRISARPQGFDEGAQPLTGFRAAFCLPPLELSRSQLASSLLSEDRQARQDAIARLSRERLPADALDRALISVLETRDEELCIELLESLALSPRSPEVLVRAVATASRSERRALRMAAVRPLVDAHRGAAIAPDAIVDLFDDDDPGVAVAALLAAAHAYPDDHEVYTRAWFDWLADADPRRRIGALTCLTELGPPPMSEWPRIEDALRDEDRRVAVAAAMTVYELKIRSPGIVDALLERTGAPSPVLVRECVQALGEICTSGDTLVVSRLRELEASTDGDVRERVRAALGRIVSR